MKKNWIKTSLSILCLGLHPKLMCISPKEVLTTHWLKGADLKGVQYSLWSCSKENLSAIKPNGPDVADNIRHWYVWFLLHFEVIKHVFKDERHFYCNLVIYWEVLDLLTAVNYLFFKISNYDDEVQVSVAVTSKEGLRFIPSCGLFRSPFCCLESGMMILTLLCSGLLKTLLFPWWSLWAQTKCLGLRRGKVIL